MPPSKGPRNETAQVHSVKRGHAVARAVLAFVFVGAVALPLLFEIAISVAPNRTREGHGLMPIGQAAFAMLGSLVLAAVASYFATRNR